MEMRIIKQEERRRFIRVSPIFDLEEKTLYILFFKVV
jgi:hypothetical protein